MSISGRRRISLAVSSLMLATLGAVTVQGTMSPSSAVAGPYCGPAIAKPSGALWDCVFADDFTGWELNRTKWTPMTTASTGVFSQDCRVDKPANIRVRSGYLRLATLRLLAPITCHTGSGSYQTRYTSGAISTGRKFSQAYGRFEIRAAFPSAKVNGLHGALWMWPQESKYSRKHAGEIDIAEFRTSLWDRVTPTLHYLADSGETVFSDWHCYISYPERLHTYAVEWNRSSMTFLYDGQECWTHAWDPADPLDAPAPFDEPFFLIMNLSLGTGHNAFDPYRTRLPAYMYIDYVRAWK